MSRGAVVILFLCAIYIYCSVIIGRLPRYILDVVDPLSGRINELHVT